MKLTSYYNPIVTLEDYIGAGIDELLLSCKELSRFGPLGIGNLDTYSKKIKQHGIKIVLDWDILMTGDAFDKALENFLKLKLETYDSIRVQDPGALNYLLENYPEIKIQWNIETGNHNLKAIEGWVNFIGPNLEKIILSSELNREKIRSYTEYFKKTPIRFEILGAGKILLFYTPRTLLSNQHKTYEDHIIAIGKSEETPHKGFKILENRHGTFMFNPKDLFLLEYMEEITQQ